MANGDDRERKTMKHQCRTSNQQQHLSHSHIGTAARRKYQYRHTCCISRMLRLAARSIDGRRTTGENENL